MSNDPPRPLFPAFAAINTEAPKRTLFPIFPGAVTSKPAPPPPSDASWLVNSSFKPPSPPVQEIPPPPPSVKPHPPRPRSPESPTEIPPPPPDIPPPAPPSVSDETALKRKKAIDFFEDYDADGTTLGDKGATVNKEVTDRTVARQQNLVVLSSDSSGDERHARKRRKEEKREKRRDKNRNKDEFGRDVKSDKTDRKTRKKDKKDKKSKGGREAKPQSILQITQRESGYADVQSRTQDYFFDVKGDYENIQFGHLYKADVSLYDRFPPFFCLGFKDPFMIGFPKEGGWYGFHPSFREYDDSLRYYRAENRLRDRKTKTIHLVRRQGEALELNADFIPLEEEQTDELEPGETQEEFLHKRAREFNQLTQSNPTNIQNWLKFAQFQDEYMIFFRNQRRKALVLEKKMSIYQKALVANPNSEDLTLGYLAAAEQLWENTKVADLWQRVLRAFTLANKEGVSERMWRAYLTFLRSDFSTFTVSNVRDMYARALQRLVVKRKGVPKGAEYEKNVETIEQTMLSTLVGWLRLERQAGYVERAVGIFQAFVEFNLFCAPHILSQSMAHQLSSFEHFWEAEAPRIGDEGSQTWYGWLMSGGDQEEMGGGGGAGEEENNRTEELVPIKMENPIAGPGTTVEDFVELDLNVISDDEEEMKNEEPEREKTEEEIKEEQTARVVMAYYEWAQEEIKREEVYWTPARPVVNVGGNVEDPERVVMFTDFKDLLFRFQTESMKLELLLQFAFFLDPRIQHTPHSPSPSSPPPLSSSTLPPSYTPNPTHPLYSTNHLLEKQEVNETEDLNDLFSLLSEVNEVAANIPIKLESGGDDEDVIVIKKEQKIEISKSKKEFIRKVFSLGYTAFPGNVALANAQLAFEFVYSPEEARKVAKELLQNNRTSLPLCCSYAKLEEISGNINPARKVFEATLSNYEKLQPAQQQTCIQLFHAYAEMEMVVAREDLAAMHILVSLAEGKFTPISRVKGKAKLDDISPPRMLKARNYFKQRFTEIQKSTSTSPLFSVSPNVHLIICYGYLEYLSLGIDKACAVFDEALGEFANDSLDHEQLQVAYVNLIHHHVSTTPSPPGLLRSVLFQAMDTYPNNPLFISLFIHSESRSKMANRQRRYFDDATERYPSPVLWLFAIKTEIKKLGSSNRVKSLFEKAIENSVTRNSIAIWREYISWLLEAGDPRGAKQVFYRAIRFLPWAKKIWLDSMRLDLRHLFTKGELTDIYQLLTEKEVRVRVDLKEGE